MEHSQNWTWKIGITSERLLECYALQEYHFCSSTVVRMSRFQPFFFALQTSTQWAWSLTRPRWSCSETRWSGSARPRPRLHTPCTGWRCAPSPPPSPSCLFMEKWLVSKSREHLWTSACRDFSFLCFFCNIPRLRFLKHKHHPSWKLRPLMAPYLALCFSGSTLKPVFFFFFFFRCNSCLFDSHVWKCVNMTPPLGYWVRSCFLTAEPLVSWAAATVQLCKRPRIVFHTAAIPNACLTWWVFASYSNCLLQI